RRRPTAGKHAQLLEPSSYLLGLIREKQAYHDFSSVLRGLPHQFADVEYELDIPLHHRLRRLRWGANLSGDDAEGVVQPSVSLVVADMPCGPDHLPPTLWIGPAVALEVEHYGCSVLGLDEALKIHLICVVGST